VNKERLHRPDFALFVLDRKVSVVEPLQKRFFDDFVVAIILPFARKGTCPMWAARQFIT